jgi:hypothetical protein
MTTSSRRVRPAYPRLALAAALGSALGLSACGPDGAVPNDDTSTQPLTSITTATPDAGPQPNDFFGGGAPPEMLEDGGVR